MDFAAARRTMVENQLRTKRVTDPGVIDAMGWLPRELFVPAELAGIAYVDEDLPLGNGRYLMEPLVLALLLQSLELRPADKLLEIGCNGGYAAAVAAQMVASVVTVEVDTAMAERAVQNLDSAGVSNVRVVTGPLAGGAAEFAPYDAILFGGAIAEVPEAVIGQLADTGRLAAVIAETQRVGVGTLLLRVSGGLARVAVFDAATPWLPGMEPKPSFVF